jgi:cellulose synthase/poly-beta-1,6-N-acetylglucosamine synthase-like glycosyltransferase
MQITRSRGALQKINVMVCTYNEPMETVKACVVALLASPAPVYCEKVIYIGDDGAKKKFDCSEQKRLMCEEFASSASHLGSNVFGLHSNWRQDALVKILALRVNSARSTR